MYLLQTLAATLLLSAGSAVGLPSGPAALQSRGVGWVKSDIGEVTLSADRSRQWGSAPGTLGMGAQQQNEAIRALALTESTGFRQAFRDALLDGKGTVQHFRGRSDTVAFDVGKVSCTLEKGVKPTDVRRQAPEIEEEFLKLWAENDWMSDFAASIKDPKRPKKKRVVGRVEAVGVRILKSDRPLWLKKILESNWLESNW